MSSTAAVGMSQVRSASRWDAEFFVNPYNAYLLTIFSRWGDWVSLASVSSKLTSGQTPLHHDVATGDTPFVTVECVEPLWLDMSKTKRVWEHDARGQLARACVARNDVLITIKRRIGVSCPILDDPDLMAVNQDVVVMTPKPGFRPAFIAAVLNSRVGRFQALRQATEQMNPYLNITALGQLLIPQVDDAVQAKVETIVRKRLELLGQSVQLYREAEAELLDRLGWEELRAQRAELSFVSNLTDTSSVGRADAEFFHPQCARLSARLSERGAQEIGQFCKKPSRGVQPEIAETGEVIVVDSKAVRPLEVEPAVGDRTTRTFYELPRNAKGRVRHGDVLLNSTGRGTLGRAACYQSAAPALCDNHVTILRPDPSVCSPVYLALFLNSPVGLAQSERFQTGSSGQLEIYPEHIQHFLILLPKRKNGSVDMAWQERLAAKVDAATAAQSAAQVKFDEAVRVVEDALAAAATP